MAADGFTFLLSVSAVQIVAEGQDDHLLDEDELIKVRRWRSVCVFAMLVPSALIAFSLSFFIKEDLRRFNHGEEKPQLVEKMDYEGGQEDNIASDDELLPEAKIEE